MATLGAASKTTTTSLPRANGRATFCLGAHNGVFYNDAELRRGHCLPPARFETNSYAAV